MARKKCTIKLQDKSLRLNGMTKGTFKLEDKSVRLNGRNNVYV